MKIATLFLLFCTYLLGCTGDCLTCHPKLVPTINEDERHKPMLTCIECHSADPNSMAECGADCFACHPMSKINSVDVEQHRVIQLCKDCHTEMKNQIFDPFAPKDHSKKETLQEFLLD